MHHNPRPCLAGAVNIVTDITDGDGQTDTGTNAFTYIAPVNRPFANVVTPTSRPDYRRNSL